ncbi:MAG: VWA domain-containing protein [Pyrinomonadaceae bacterium]
MPAGQQSKDRSANSDDVITVESNLTNLLFTAVDRDRRYVTSLRREDLRILEDKVPQEIFTFERQTDLALSLAILIDVSGSQERTLPDEKIAARRFIESVIRPAKDEAAVISFAGEAVVEQTLTSSKRSLQQAIERVHLDRPPGYAGGGIIVQGGIPSSGGGQTPMGSTGSVGHRVGNLRRSSRPLAGAHAARDHSSDRRRRHQQSREKRRGHRAYP